MSLVATFRKHLNVLAGLLILAVGVTLGIFGMILLGGGTVISVLPRVLGIACFAAWTVWLWVSFAIWVAELVVPSSSSE